MKTIRWGIVGPGNIARKFARAVKNIPGAELAAVASRNEEKAKAFADAYGIPHAFEGYEAMAAFDGIDAVYIATPHPFHKPCAEMFINAGKHVLCEKPVCVNAAQAEQLQKCAEEKGVFLMEAVWTRFLPAILEAQRLVKEGRIGELRGLEADFCYGMSTKVDSYIYRNELAGGALLDVGIYGLTFAALFLGTDPVKITADADVWHDVDRQNCVVLKYENGALANITSAVNLFKPETAYLYGSKGYISIPTFYGAQELFVHVDGETEHIAKPSLGEGFEEEILEACKCIREGKQQSDILPMAESIKLLRQMDAIRKQIGIRYPWDEE